MNRPTPPADKGVGTDSKQYPGNSGTKKKQGESEENIENHEKTGRNRGKHRKTRRNREKLGKT